MAPSDRTKGNGNKLKYKVPLNIMKHFFIMQRTKYCHRLPREVVEFPSFDIQKLTGLLGNMQ